MWFTLTALRWSFYMRKSKKKSFFVFFSQSQHQMQSSQLWRLSEIGHVWVRWKALFKTYPSSCQISKLGPKSKLPAAESYHAWRHAICLIGIERVNGNGKSLLMSPTALFKIYLFSVSDFQIRSWIKIRLET